MGGPESRNKTFFSLNIFQTTSRYVSFLDWLNGLHNSKKKLNVEMKLKGPRVRKMRKLETIC
jgi:hypothetical protein